MRGEIEATLRRIQQTSSDLLLQLEDADTTTTELLRNEITRLADCGFVLTRLLCRDDIERAYEIVCGDPDEDGTSLGLVG